MLTLLAFSPSPRGRPCPSPPLLCDHNVDNKDKSDDPSVAAYIMHRIEHEPQQAWRNILIYFHQ